ncbi:septation protein SepH [Leifsonia sp. YIM 134122]|uniref:Septation protein SepH n=1 Tax=Leifsonia stereocauli TaxID=3134136 RepID=A0ABU9W299_9MICO
MQELKVIGVENGALVVASDDGDRFRIVIDEVMQSRLRRANPEPAGSQKPSPREVQAYVRSGMSAEDVAAVTGASLEYIQRFEGPVLAEREHVLTSALSVPVHPTQEPDPADDDSSFGGVMRQRLASLGAFNERWASWKEPAGGWIIKLEFTADSIDHDARWGFEPKKLALAPLNSEAVTLSQQGELSGSLIPRLRAVDTTDADQSRFDSGAFTFRDPLIEQAEVDVPAEPIPYGRTGVSSAAVTKAAINRADDPPKSLSETADLLEALRRRRGERETANFDGDPTDAPSVAPARSGNVTDQPELPIPATIAPPASAPTAASGARRDWANQTGGVPSASRKKGRTSMPSWDEIVFGARTDDDLA